jgi:hypothetical protein
LVVYAVGGQRIRSLLSGGKVTAEIIAEETCNSVEQEENRETGQRWSLAGNDMGTEKPRPGYLARPQNSLQFCGNQRWQFPISSGLRSRD